jgi:hypothetical protein
MCVNLVVKFTDLNSIGRDSFLDLFLAEQGLSLLHGLWVWERH